MPPSHPCGVLNVTSWNLQGKSLQHLDDWYMETGDYYDFFCLQEVGQVHKLSVIREFGHGVFEFKMQDAGEFFNYHAIGTSRTSAHLGQMILLHKECVQFVDKAWVGDRYLAVQMRMAGTGYDVVLASCHLPHSDLTDDQFHTSLRDITQLLLDHRHLPILTCGDFNCAEGTDRALAVDSCFSVRGGLTFRSGQPTRFGIHSQSELDYACCNRQFVELLVPEPDAVLTNAHPLNRVELGSDHCNVSFMIALKDPFHEVPLRPKRRRNPRPRRCRRWVVNTEMLSESLPQLREQMSSMSLQGQWEALQKSCAACSKPRASLKYQDTPNSNISATSESSLQITPSGLRSQGRYWQSGIGRGAPGLKTSMIGVLLVMHKPSDTSDSARHRPLAALTNS